MISALLHHVGLFGVFLQALSGVLTGLYGLTTNLAVANTYSTVTIMALNGWLQLPFVEAYMNMTKAAHILSREEMIWMIPRALTTNIGNACIILTVAYIPLGDAAALHNLTIPFTMVMGRLFLKEELKFIEICSVVLALAGGMLVSQPTVIFSPGTTEDTAYHNRLYGVIFGVATGFLYASTYTIHFAKLKDSPPATVTFYAGLCTAVGFTATSLVLGHTLVVCQVESRAAILASSLAISFSLIACVAGSPYVTSGLCSIIIFTAYMITGFVIQLLYGIIPNLWTIAGAVLVSLSLGLNVVSKLHSRRTPVTKEEEEDPPESVLYIADVAKHVERVGIILQRCPSFLPINPLMPSVAYTQQRT